MDRSLFDEKCLDLAEYFTSDVSVHPDYVNELAADIQQAAEDWFATNAAVIKSK